MQLPPTLHPLIERIASHADALGLSLYAVGGFTRDLLRGQPTLDLDLVVERGVLELVQRLVTSEGGSFTYHAPFLTATWTRPTPEAGTPATLDFATARTERYPEPAQLPIVAPSTIERDLARRDFTINAMALRLAPEPLTLLDRHGGEADLRAGVVRVLHERSFIDDPTRMFRAARFEQRFGFQIEANTLSWHSSALPYIDRLTGERVRHEFVVIFGEAAPEKALRRLTELGVLGQVNAGLAVDETLACAFESSRILLLREPPESGWRPLTTDLAHTYWALLGSRLVTAEACISRLMLTRDEAIALRHGTQLTAILPRLGGAHRPSDIDEVLSGIGAAALVAGWALAADNPEAQAKIDAYARQWRHVQAALKGDDLKQMGLPAGKLFGTLLRQLRRARLDGVVVTADDERVYVRRLLDEGVGRKDSHDRD
jgi:tRNA nucleotidyltransferase (CCA-adding enzyme)